MNRVAIYARYSSELQNDASVEDQIRLCQEKAKAEGWQVGTIYTDHGISGSSMMLRPGVQQLMQDGLAGKYDILLAEALDRISRDQEDKRRYSSDKEAMVAGVGFEPTTFRL